MRIPTKKDFEELNDWGLIENPLKAIEDYSEKKEEKRWNNERNNRAKKEYLQRRTEWGDEGFQEHYKNMSRPVDKAKWEYLKKRKSWYICPLKWGRFASPDVVRILDFGCGDGDVTQRVAEYVSGCWKKSSYDGSPLQIIGLDLNSSRIRNAKNLCSSPHPKINFLFEQDDVAKNGIGFEDDYFDYALATGVFETLGDELADRTIDELSRVVTRGVYVEDQLDEYPGGFPRPGLSDLFEDRGFKVADQYKVLSEPFVESGTRDPLDIWPTFLLQVFFAEFEAGSMPSDRFESR